MQADAVVTTVKGEKIRVEDVIHHLKFKGQFREAIYELIEQRVVRLMAEELSVSVDDAEVAARAGDRRATLGIESPERFAAYLRFYGTAEAVWTENIQLEALREALKAKIVPAERVDAEFRRDPSRFASVSLSRIACRTRRQADQVAAAARKGDFVELARTHSCDDNTRMSGGYVGHVKPAMLPPEAAEAVFGAGTGAKAGAILGPFAEHGLWTVYQVHTINTPELTDALRRSIRDQIFAEWLRAKVMTVPA